MEKLPSECTLREEETLKCIQGKMRLAKCLEDKGFREKLLCRPAASVRGTFAEKAAVGPVVLEFALISAEHFSRSHQRCLIALLWLPEISLPSEHSL